ncbi:MAG: SGNH/GDSL hydrolase family protein [Candidatus Omnitrophica bacterium]|nr:SGNH/GDSL hydrolase family protein [Candidatus Omnitrophota bacterium]
MYKKRNTIFVNIFLLLFTILFFFVCGELVIRVLLLIRNRGDFIEIIRHLPEVRDGSRVTLGSMIQPSVHRKIIYELRPGLNVNFVGGIVKTNAQGFRSDRDFAVDKPAGCVRIVCVGDSFMFGEGVDQGNNWTSFLEQALNEKYPQKKWEVLNLAVPGYNTVMEVETLEKRGLIFRPDIVIIEYIGNDLDLPNFIYQVDDWRDTTRSYFFDFITRHLTRLRRNFELFEAPHDASAIDYVKYESDHLKVPARYRDMVGWNAYAQAMVKLKKLQLQRNFTVINLLTITHHNERIFSLSKKQGFLTVYNQAFVPELDSTLVLSKKDWHYSVKGHKNTAIFLLKTMEEKGVIKRYL